MTERKQLDSWQKKRISAAALEKWVNSTVYEAWGFKAANRAFHIANTGMDVMICGQHKGHSPTTISVRDANPVPGAARPSRTVYDLSQVLSWLARERTDLHEQHAWREQIPSLLAAI